jgi:hypothetical protein
VGERPAGELLNLRYGSIDTPKRKKVFSTQHFVKAKKTYLPCLVAGAGFGSQIHVLGPAGRAARAVILLPAK